MRSLLAEPLTNGIFKKKDDFGSGVKLINVFDLYQDTEIDPLQLERVRVSESELRTFGVHKGDVFFCRSSLKPEGIAWSCWVRDVSEPTVFECHIIRAKVNSNIALPAFISNYARTDFARSYLLAQANVTTMATIDQTSIAGLPVILPSLEIQRALVDELEAARDERRRKLAEANALLIRVNESFQQQLGVVALSGETRSVFAIRLGQLRGNRMDVSINNLSINKAIHSKYDSFPLKSLVMSFSGGTPSKASSDFWIGQIPWVSPKDFRDFYLEDAEDHISEEGMSDATLKLVPKNSILVVVRSGVLKHTLPVVINLQPVTINQDIKALIPTSAINAEYLAFYFRVLSNRLLPIITKHSTTVQSINTAQFESLPIPVPPLSVQQSLAQEMKQAIEKAKQLRQEAETEWQAAKRRFEEQLLAGEAV